MKKFVLILCTVGCAEQAAVGVGALVSFPENMMRAGIEAHVMVGNTLGFASYSGGEFMRYPNSVAYGAGLGRVFFPAHPNTLLYAQVLYADRVKPGVGIGLLGDPYYVKTGVVVNKDIEVSLSFGISLGIDQTKSKTLPKPAELQTDYIPTKALAMRGPMSYTRKERAAMDGFEYAFRECLAKTRQYDGDPQKNCKEDYKQMLLQQELNNKDSRRLEFIQSERERYAK